MLHSLFEDAVSIVSRWGIPDNTDDYWGSSVAKYLWRKASSASLFYHQQGGNPEICDPEFEIRTAHLIRGMYHEYQIWTSITEYTDNKRLTWRADSEIGNHPDFIIGTTMS